MGLGNGYPLHHERQQQQYPTAVPVGGIQTSERIGYDAERQSDLGVMPFSGDEGGPASAGSGSAGFLLNTYRRPALAAAHADL